jgi:hypothetical protein
MAAPPLQYNGQWLAGSRGDTWTVWVAIDGQNMGWWDTFSGGEVDSEETKYRPGGADREISLGGRRTFGNVTVDRYSDWWTNWMAGWLQARCGKGRAQIARYPMDADFNNRGRVINYWGTLKACTLPDVDSMDNDVAKIELEITVDNITHG